ncbi:MAG TPA: tRNA uridine-5-carboxymethylaminomethyl(34) synthesis GTPase MnmE [Spongiibacteraceae bacterium]|nr:tRNA uridine-5-carboxymethylaminomethyl(34) synthesis GTPase MnmE [Spongiibacteraceae bacterium]
MTSLSLDTIAAIATPTGRGGVGIVRISGPLAAPIMVQVLGKTIAPRHAHYGAFYEHGANGPQVLDNGIALFFPGPNSFTGEDVLELQGHGGPVILDCLLREILQLGARLARPGEFSERAFLNDKIDLTQAEAIADLIDSASEQAARSALRSLQGEFSRHIDTLIDNLTALRIYVEAAIDFPEEEIDFLADGKVARDLDNLLEQLDLVLLSTRQGALLREGITVVIAGAPNAGKSSLLNALAGRDSAIVTPIAGTTRDVLREHIQIDGLPLHIIDTAGLRDSPDEIEREGIRRAWREIENADHLLLVVDSQLPIAADISSLWPGDAPVPLENLPLTIVRNKCDLSNLQPTRIAGSPTTITLSAKTGAGLDLLRQHLKESVGFATTSEGNFLARRRHVDALQQAREYLCAGQRQLLDTAAGELLAEDLRLCQRTLGEITGAVSADDLLGKIFSSFCIGK